MNSLFSLAALYLRELEMQGFSPSTIKTRGFNLKSFSRFCSSFNLALATEISEGSLDDYLHFLKEEKGLQPCSVKNHLETLRSFFKWLVEINELLLNPASRLKSPKTEAAPFKEVLTEQEVEKILASVPINKALGLRDRAILECFYSTGMRRNELIHLKLQDVDWKGESLFIAQGKGSKQRILPIGERALQWIKSYLTGVRGSFEKEPCEWLFLNSHGSQIGEVQLSFRIRTYFQKAGVQKKGSCHLFRHTMASLMLQNGADLISIQKILGHSRIITTQIYTHLTIERIKAVHEQTHPAALLKEELPKGSLKFPRFKKSL